MKEPEIPTTVSTGCGELDQAWSAFASQILAQEGIMIPDTDEDLSWHAFLGHSIDMQGWRAAEFVGVDALTKEAPGFVPLIEQGRRCPRVGSTLGDSGNPGSLATWDGWSTRVGNARCAENRGRSCRRVLF